jgi:hypothetical protein
LWPVFGRYGLRGLLLDVRGRLDVEGLLARGAEGRDALGRLDVEGLLARGAEGRDALGREMWCAELTVPNCATVRKAASRKCCA